MCLFSFSLKFKSRLANMMFAVSVPHLMCKNAKVLPETWVRPSFVVMLQAGLEGSGQVLLPTLVLIKPRKYLQYRFNECCFL